MAAIYGSASRAMRCKGQCARKTSRQGQSGRRTKFQFAVTRTFPQSNLSDIVPIDQQNHGTTVPNHDIRPDLARPTIPSRHGRPTQGTHELRHADRPRRHPLRQMGHDGTAVTACRADDGLAMWVADMEFRPPACVQTRGREDGWPMASTAISATTPPIWMRSAGGWTPATAGRSSRDQIFTTHGLVNGTAHVHRRLHRSRATAWC